MGQGDRDGAFAALEPAVGIIVAAVLFVQGFAAAREPGFARLRDLEPSGTVR